METKQLEQAKIYYFIDENGNILSDNYVDDITDFKRKRIGNYFESVEEAKRAVEKLKAWKRLKDNGLKFGHFVIDHEKKCGKLTFKADDASKTFDEAQRFYSALVLLFGGEE